MKRRKFIQALAMSPIGFTSVQNFTCHTSAVNANEKIKIAQIGVSHDHASGKINSLKKLTDIFEIVGVVDDRNINGVDSGTMDLRPYEGLEWIEEEELFKIPGLKAVLVETRNSKLVPTSIRCMNNNLSMHMDKPGGDDLKSLKKLLNGCQQKNLAFQMGYMFRNNPAIQFCQKAVRENWLGDIFEIEGSMSHNYGGEDYQFKLSQTKGGIMYVLGCHMIDLIISMMGRPIKVTPFLRSTMGALRGTKNNCLTVLEYPHTIVTLHATDNEIGGMDKRILKICGSKGTIELSPLERYDGKPLKMEMTLNEGNHIYSSGYHILNFGVMHDRFKDQLIEFANIIKGDMQNPYTYNHDYITQEVVLASSGYSEFK